MNSGRPAAILYRVQYLHFLIGTVGFSSENFWKIRAVLELLAVKRKFIKKLYIF